MKIEVKKTPAPFEPREITISLETNDDLLSFSNLIISGIQNLPYRSISCDLGRQIIDNLKLKA